MVFPGTTRHVQIMILNPPHVNLQMCNPDELMARTHKPGSHPDGFSAVLTSSGCFLARPAVLGGNYYLIPAPWAALGALLESVPTNSVGLPGYSVGARTYLVRPLTNSVGLLMNSADDRSNSRY